MKSNRTIEDTKDEDLLAGLAEAARRDLERERLPGDAWEKLAAGTLTDEERRALEEAALDDPEVREGLLALAPMDADAEARVIARIDAARSPEGRVVPLASRRAGWGRRMPWLAAAAAVALVVGFSALRPRAGEALPEYAMEVSGEDQASRGGAHDGAPQADEPMRVRAASPIAIVLRPNAKTSAAVGVHVTIERDGHAAPSNAPVEIAPTGAVKIAARAGSLLGAEPGRVDVVVDLGAGTSERRFRAHFDVQP